MITISAENASALRQCVRQFDELQNRKMQYTAGDWIQIFNKARDQQMDIAFTMVGIVDGVLKANGV